MDPGIEVSTETAAEALRTGEAQVVDVREPYEHEAGHVATTLHIPLGELGDRAAELAADRPVLVLCRVGGRSNVAARALRRAGYDAWSIAGGILAWDGEGRPLAPEGGVVADH